MEELIDAIDVSVPAAPRNIISTRLGLKNYFQQFREGPECSKGMKYEPNSALQSSSNWEPLAFEDCIGKPGFGSDVSKPVPRLARRYFEELGPHLPANLLTARA